MSELSTVLPVENAPIAEPTPPAAVEPVEPMLTPVSAELAAADLRPGEAPTPDDRRVPPVQ